MPNSTHRKVAASKLKRPLRKGEVVHHANGSHGDNRHANLKVVSKPMHDHIETQAKKTPYVQNAQKMGMNPAGMAPSEAPMPMMPAGVPRFRKR